MGILVGVGAAIVAIVAVDLVAFTYIERQLGDILRPRRHYQRQYPKQQLHAMRKRRHQKIRR